MRLLGKALTFDDILLVPAFSEVLPKDTDLATRFTRNIQLGLPLVSAAMDTVTEARLAITIAQEGGIGVIHKNLTAKEQAAQKKKTGLVTVDTGTYWSSFGQWVIMALFQIGGFGMMTAATLLGLLVNRSFRLRTRLTAQAETHTLGIGDVSSVAKLVLFVTVIVEVMTALALALRLHLGYDLPLAEAAWSGLFHSVSAFNNAGFSIHADGLIRYASDSYFLAPVMLAIVIGGLGFPVLQDLRNKLRDPQHWSVHTKLTLVGTAVLLAGGAILLLAFEWANPRTLGSMPAGDKLLSAIFASVSARTAAPPAVPRARAPPASAHGRQRAAARRLRRAQRRQLRSQPPAWPATWILRDDDSGWIAQSGPRRKAGPRGFSGSRRRRSK